MHEGRSGQGRLRRMLKHAVQDGALSQSQKKKTKHLWGGEGGEMGGHSLQDCNCCADVNTQVFSMILAFSFLCRHRSPTKSSRTAATQPTIRGNPPLGGRGSKSSSQKHGNTHTQGSPPQPLTDGKRTGHLSCSHAFPRGPHRRRAHMETWPIPVARVPCSSRLNLAPKAKQHLST